MTSTAFIALGSNLGDKLSNCENAIRTLETSGIEILARSHFYKTMPVDYTDQDWFVNAAIKVRTKLMPPELLSLLKSVEKAFGRTETVRFGPRVLDMDIIFYDDLVMNDERLSIPHPRMHDRRFVLKPICDLEPDFVHPILRQNISELLKLTDNDSEQGVIRYE